MTPIYVDGRGGSNYTPHPAGQFQARCIDVVDLGWAETDYGPKYKVRLSFYCGEDGTKQRDDGPTTYPMIVSAKFTASLHEKAKLREFIESWGGRPLTAEELEKFDLERLVGAPAFIQVVHNAVGDRVYANIKGIMPLPKGMHAPETPADFIRMCNRPEWEGPAPHPDMSKPSKAEPTVTTPPTFGDPGDGLPF